MRSHLIAIACGVLTWTLLEYMIHRWMGHDRRFRRPPFGVEHIRHHIEGNYFAPTWKKLVVAAITGPVVATPAIALVGWTNGILYTVGLLAFYALQHPRD